MNTLTPSRPTKSLKSPAFSNRNRSAFIPGAVEVRQGLPTSVPTQAVAQTDVKHHLWSTRGLTEAQAVRLLNTAARPMDIAIGEEGVARVRRLQAEAVALAVVLSSIVVTFANLILA